MKQRIRSIVIGAAIIAALAASSASAQPQGAPIPQPEQRICRAWAKQCVSYRYIFGRPVCKEWKFVCIRWY
jgi:hypothetical protein